MASRVLSCAVACGRCPRERTTSAFNSKSVFVLSSLLVWQKTLFLAGIHCQHSCVVLQ